jgi:hypothetical protein
LRPKSVLASMSARVRRSAGVDGEIIGDGAVEI